MAQKTIWLPDIGEVTLSKRKGSKNIRLSISAAGKVRVGLPAWAPYATGVSFVKSRSEWVKAHIDSHQIKLLTDGSRIGKSFRLVYVYQPLATKTSTRITQQRIVVTSNLPLNHPQTQTAATRASERALKQEATKLLPNRLETLANRYEFSYKNIKIKKLVSRWGSCSSDKTITLNYFLMQLPWELIDYVIVHELVHTKNLNHSDTFWNNFETIYPSAKKTRQLLKDYRPVLNTVA